MCLQTFWALALSSKHRAKWMYHKKAPTSVTVTHRSQQGEIKGRKIHFLKNTVTILLGSWYDFLTFDHLLP